MNKQRNINDVNKTFSFVKVLFISFVIVNFITLIRIIRYWDDRLLSLGEHVLKIYRATFLNPRVMHLIIYLAVSIVDVCISTMQCSGRRAGVLRYVMWNCLIRVDEQGACRRPLLVHSSQNLSSFFPTVLKLVSNLTCHSYICISTLQECLYLTSVIH